METSAITRSESTNSRNISSRILPCRVISRVVRPWIPASLSAGAIRSFSTRSKSMPSCVPKGRTMKARANTMTEILGLGIGILASGRRPPLRSLHIEAGREVFRLELHLRGKPSDVGKVPHIVGVVHRRNLRDGFRCQVELDRGFQPAGFPQHVIARIGGEWRAALAVQLHIPHRAVNRRWCQAVGQPLQHLLIY